MGESVGVQGEGDKEHCLECKDASEPVYHDIYVKLAVARCRYDMTTIEVAN